jgi:hypothetical protein
MGENDELTLGWAYDGWVYKIQPEGKLWRFSGEHRYTDSQGEEHVLRPDFGLLPGGAFVAIRDLLSLVSTAPLLPATMQLESARDAHGQGG